ncbi:DUF1801 domain-containing protein [Mucilaginibacter sp. BJC16-A38]|uniref:iron chaperone n=1 Tax=Mucilaginibacter phenanthrenivorans TaxID=1234842 RepID=UPI0021579DA1|nr:DUF1801 domain-containing protein [Mucilaginibacter phenanthrenivorans]MCR8557992.1 DUF1801 domain-containing protein [Mucilaginibacter phenanthrenivorans]
MKPNGLEIFNAYLERQDDKLKPGLVALRELILSIVPDAEESFSYQVHCFKHIYMLVGIGVTKESCSLYTMSPPLIKKMKEELKGYKASGATIHFKPDDHLPVNLIAKIVLNRIQENEALALGRGKKK